MERNENCRYNVKITADKRIYEDLKNENISIRYPDNCKRCKRHRKNTKKRRSKNHYNERHATKPTYLSFEKTDSYNQSENETDRDMYDRKMPISSPVNWQTSPLQQYSNIRERKWNNQSKHLYNEDKTLSHQADSCDGAMCYISSPAAKQKYQDSSRRKTSLASSNSSNTPFIIVNIPTNTFTTTLDTRNNHCDVALNNNSDNSSVSNDTIVSDVVKCRYCLSSEDGGWGKNEGLISPCLCSGSSKYVHQSCLEKWLTLRNISECEVCRTTYETKWVHRSLCSLKFPTMEKRDVFLLVLTISFYITLIFQFLGAVYVSIMASMLPTMVRIITLLGLSLGLFWFLIGCITLTIVTYSSEYWKKWRNSNKRKTLILQDSARNEAINDTVSLVNSVYTERRHGFVRENINLNNLSCDLSMAVPV